MSATWIDGVGLVHMAGGKSPTERDATIQYFMETSPKMENLGFFGDIKKNFKDAFSQSIIYEEWLNRDNPITILNSLLDQKKITEEEYKKAIETGKVKRTTQKVREGFEFFQQPENPEESLNVELQEAQKLFLYIQSIDTLLRQAKGSDLSINSGVEAQAMDILDKAKQMCLTSCGCNC